MESNLNDVSHYGTEYKSHVIKTFNYLIENLIFLRIKILIFWYLPRKSILNLTMKTNWKINKDTE